MRFVAESVDRRSDGSCRGNHGVSLQERNPATLIDVFGVLPDGWSRQQCATCGMVFELPPDELSGIKAKDSLTEELERHVQQNHIDLPSAWESMSISRLDDHPV